MAAASLRARFPGIARSDWARFDGPAGTQMVDTAMAAVTDWMASGSTAAAGGPFQAADDCERLLTRARAAVGDLFGADPEGICFGANMTTLTFMLSRAVASTLRSGDRIVGTRLDHDANITPWRRAAESAGAEHVLADFDGATGELDPQRVIDLIDATTRWVTVPGASNLLGTVPDLDPIIEAAHDVGAHVFVDAVHLAPHQRIDIAALGCDALATSPYKWYGPHAGVVWIRPELLADLPVVKVRPSPDVGPKRFETGMPDFDAIAGVEAAARFLLEEGMDRLAAAESEVFAPLLDGLHALDGVHVWGPRGMEGRTPTAAFTIDGISPLDVATALAGQRIAVWNGHNYAVEVVEVLGLADSGGVVRAGVSRYTSSDDVERLLAAVHQIASTGVDVTARPR